jgi:Leucine-rich repeat (LRR) protein
LLNWQSRSFSQNFLTSLSADFLLKNKLKKCWNMWRLCKALDRLKAAEVFSSVQYSFEMILKKCFFIELLAVLAMCAVGVGAADVILNATCTYPGMIKISKQTFGANDVVQDISVDLPCIKDSVTYVNIYWSQFNYLPPALFTIFPNLQKLHITTSTIQEIRPNTFQNAKKLTFVQTYLNAKIRSLNDDSFVGATSLQSLWMDGENFTINKNIFRGLTELSLLYLSGANLSTLEKTTFTDCTKLRFLHLPGCPIKSVDPQTFSGMKNLDELSLHNSQLTSLDAGLLQNNPKLRIINLSKNKLSALADGFFKNNPNLTDIILHSNQLEICPSGWLANTPILQNLDLRWNKIKSLSSTVFQKLPKLKWLQLSNNLLTSLPKDLFSGATGLAYIWLDSNQLNAIDQATFNNLKNLTYVALKNNTCINIDFPDYNSIPIAPFNATALMDALAKSKCDENANINSCPTNNNSALKEQLKTIASMLANASSILLSITSKL